MQIVDNALAKEVHDELKSIIFETANHFPWFYSDSIAIPKSHDGYYFVHDFYKEYNFVSNHAFLVVPLLKLLEPKALIRIKANLYPSNPTFVAHAFHVDQYFPHKGAVYYVNSNDGYTELHDGTKIDSVENRLMLFDSAEEHRSTGCTNANVRVTINFNYF